MENTRIVWEDAEGLKVLIPIANSGLTLEQIIEKDVPKGVDYVVTDKSEIPADRFFRDAWKRDGQKIAVDMPKARVIHMRKIRLTRDKKLKDLDAETMKYMNNNRKLDKVEVKKQTLRDLPASLQPLVDAAQTPEELKAVPLE